MKKIRTKRPGKVKSMFFKLSRLSRLLHETYFLWSLGFYTCRRQAIEDLKKKIKEDHEK